MCCFNEALQKVTVFYDSTERLFVYAVAQQRKEPQFNVGGNTNQMNKVHFDLMKKPVSALFVFKLLPNHPVWLLVGVQWLWQADLRNLPVFQLACEPFCLLYLCCTCELTYRLLAVSTGTGLTEMAFCILLFLIDLLCSNCLSPITWKKRNLTHTLVNKHTDTDAREKWIGGEGSNILLLFLFLTGCIAAQRCALQLIIMTMGKQVESTSYLTAC